MAEKILIVDDDADTVRYISAYLKSQGFETIEAYEGVSALKMAHELRPDLVILDVMMPGMDGNEVARRLRRQPNTAMLPILMFTAKSQMEDKLQGYTAGVDIYLTKPAHPVELNANIKALLAQSKLRMVDLTEKGYLIGVIGPKGGLGVSTVCLNLAVSCAQHAKKTAIAMETRPGQSTWRVELNLANPASLDHLLAMTPIDITTAAINEQLTQTNFGVQLLLASNTVQDLVSLTAVNHYDAILENIRELANVIVVDIGTNFHPAFDTFTRLCNEIIVVSEPNPLTLKLTRQLIDDLKTHNFGSSKALTLITVNRVRAEMSIPVSKIEENLGYSVTQGFVPVPEQAFLAAERAIPLRMVQPEGTVARQFDSLSDLVITRIKV